MSSSKTNGENQDTTALPDIPPAQICPDGTKVWMMNLGYLECDEAFLIRGVNCSKLSTRDEAFVNKRRKIPMYSLLISHPHEGLILWEVGSSKVSILCSKKCSVRSESAHRAHFTSVVSCICALFTITALSRAGKLS